MEADSPRPESARGCDGGSARRRAGGRVDWHSSFDVAGSSSVLGGAVGVGERALGGGVVAGCNAGSGGLVVGGGRAARSAARWASEDDGDEVLRGRLMPAPTAGV